MDKSVAIFVSYSHENRFEAMTLANELARIGYQSWIDFNGIIGGDDWRESIEQALQSALAVLIILTPESIKSQWVLYEIERAKSYQHIIIPVLFRKCQIPKILEAYQYVDFTSGPNYDGIFRALTLAVTRKIVNIRAKDSALDQDMTNDYEHISFLSTPKEHLSLERPDGTMRAESLFYVERRGDHILRRELDRKGVTVVIKAPRQVGKSSMLVHSISYANKIEKLVALLDFQSLDTIYEPQAFYQEFCLSISDKLGLKDYIDEAWKKGRSNTRACTLYMEKFILSQLSKPLVLGIDETDRMFDCPFRSDFFGMLRSWHNSRGIAGSIWQQLDMILVISTEPYMLIENSAQSPFNVGEIIQLEDFSKEDIDELNQRHGNPFTPEQLTQLYKLLLGHPYLTRQALYRVAVNEISPEQILDESIYLDGDGGIFSDHLRRYISYFNEQPQLKQVMLDIIDRKKLPSEIDFQRLHGAGLIRIYQQKTIGPRCKLYYLFFKKRLRI